MEKILRLIKKCIPAKTFKALQPTYHFLLNFFAGAYYGFPSRRLLVVGVTGTTGKTTVTYMIAKMLEGAGVSVGYTSTAMFHDGEREWLNDKKMTMMGRTFTQKMLKTMVNNGVQVALVETTSEGAVQYRHRFINYDVFVFTGLYPEHIESHGSFENYKNAKLSLFGHLAGSRQKTLPEFGTVPKTIIVNGDDEHAGDFLNFGVSQRVAFTNADARFDEDVMIQKYAFVQTNAAGVSFNLGEQNIQLKLLGEFSATNAAAAGCVGRAIGLSDDDIKKGLGSIQGIPGRLEKIENDLGATIIVDYAFESKAFTSLYETVTPLHPKKIIHVFGAAGGGRDTDRRDATGQIAGEKADIMIVTDEDPYDDDPREIMEMVAVGARKKGKIDGEDLLIIEDRQKAIDKAVSLLEKGDLLLVTGKGSEQAIARANGQMQKWDDRDAVRKSLVK